MQVNDESLLRAGFSPADLKKIRKKTEAYEITIEDVITVLANRFSLFLWFTSVFILFFIHSILARDEDYAVAAGIISLFIITMIAIFASPLILSYKAWQFRRKSLKT